MTTFHPTLALPTALFASPASSILLPIALGTFVGYSVRPKRTQTTYASLRQPPFRPPPWLFGPAWTVLYGLMGYASHRAYTAALTPQTTSLFNQGATLYSVQLGLNLVWMPLFFALKKPVLATVDIVALTGTVGYLAYVWGQVDAVAGWCLAPYLGWLGFATYLTIGVGVLNDWDIRDRDVKSE